MRVAVVFHDFHLEASLPRERVHLACGLVGEGVEVHCYTNPETRGVEPAGVEFHDVRPTRRSDGRVGHAVECGSFAWKATRLLREHRARYDVIDVAGTAAWEHDVVRVQAVPAAMQRRWPEFAGRNYRAARPRARVAHLLHPAQGVARATQRLQFRPGHYSRAVAVADLVRADLEQVHGVPSNRIRGLPAPDRASATELERQDEHASALRPRKRRADPALRRPRLRAKGTRSGGRGDGFGEPERPPRRGRGRRSRCVPIGRRAGWSGRAGSFRRIDRQPGALLRGGGHLRASDPPGRLGYGRDRGDGGRRSGRYHRRRGLRR